MKTTKQRISQLLLRHDMRQIKEAEMLRKVERYGVVLHYSDTYHFKRLEVLTKDNEVITVNI